MTVGALALLEPAASDTYTVIMQGNVVMVDGSPPPKTAGIERVCSDVQGSAPGPITDKKGHYLWRQDLDRGGWRLGANSPHHGGEMRRAAVVQIIPVH